MWCFNDVRSFNDVWSCWLRGYFSCGHRCILTLTATFSGLLDLTANLHVCTEFVHFRQVARTSPFVVRFTRDVVLLERRDGSLAFSGFPAVDCVRNDASHRTCISVEQDGWLLLFVAFFLEMYIYFLWYNTRVTSCYNPGEYTLPANPGSLFFA